MNRRDKESVLEEQVVVYRSSNQTEDVDQDAFHEEDILAVSLSNVLKLI